MTTGPISSRDFAVLLAILFVALALRIIGLNGPLWYDEIQTLDSHIRLPWSDMMQSYSMNHHYLHNLQAKLVIDQFGDANWALRLPALLFGVASIAAAWWLARDIAGTGVAHLVAALLTVSYHHIWFSQNARGYTELAFWGTVGTILFLRGLQRPTVAIWLAYALTLVLAAFTHLTGLFLYAAQGVIWIAAVAANYRQGWNRRILTCPMIGYLVGGFLTLLVYLPIFTSLLETMGGVSDTSAVDVMTEYQNPFWTLTEAIRTAIGSLGPLVSLVAGAVIICSILGGVATRRNAPWFAVMVLAHIGLTLGLLLALNMRVWPRFFFVDIAFLMILIVLGVRSVCYALAFWRPVWGRRLFLLAAVAMMSLSAVLAVRNYSAPKQDLAGAFDFVESRRGVGDKVFGVGPAGQLFRDHFGADWQIIETEQSYDEALMQEGPVWLVVAFPQRMFRGLPQMKLDREGPLGVQREFPGTLGDGWVVVLKRD